MTAQQHPTQRNSPKLVLASGSSYKRDLLERLHLDFSLHPPDIDESSRPDESPTDTARRLAAEKARHVRTKLADEDAATSWIIAADQIIELDGERLTKPGSPARAVDQLQRLAGRTHQLSTAVAVAPPTDSVRLRQVHFAMTMRPLDTSDIKQYVQTDNPVDCAGAYKIERSGIRLFESMDGDDYTAIIGLPLTRVWSLLDNTGYFA